MGIRTTVKTKRQGLTLLKKFIEEKKLIINDKQTLDELFNFIEQKKGTYGAEEGYHDDLVMSLMLCFAPFLDFKNFDDFKGFVDYIEQKEQELEQQETDFMNFMDLGFVDDGTNEDSPFTSDLWDDKDSFNH